MVSELFRSEIEICEAVRSRVPDMRRGGAKSLKSQPNRQTCLGNCFGIVSELSRTTEIENVGSARELFA